ncbi:cupin-like domain-containing protein [Litorimonas sp.]|uniref:cupin-like domain-containing protein n=1 Tax=Litorimonas sp. TaxID=1892381 RepID=UPI003A8A640A
MFQDIENQNFISAPIWIKFIYICRHLANTQNIFLEWERRCLSKLHEKYQDLPDGETLDIPEFTVENFDYDAFKAAGRDIRPFVIRNFCDPSILSWDSLKSEYGGTRVPTHPNAEPNKDFTYHTVQYTTLRDTIEKMERDDPAYVIGSSQLFLDHPELADSFPSGKISKFFKREIIRKEVFIGGPKVGSSFHCAGGDNIFFMAHGRKKWLFVSPKNYMAMYPTYGRDRESYVHTSELDSHNYDALQKERFPLFSKINKYSVTLEPGDLLFNPTMWWHEVRNLDRTIGVPHRTISTAGRNELPSWLNLAKKNALEFLVTSLVGRFTGKTASIDNSDEMIIATYGGSRKVVSIK